MNPARGIAFKLISAALFAVMQALIRYLGARYPVGQVVFYRSIFAIIPVVLVYAWRGELAAVVRTERPLGQAGRGVLSIAGMFFNFGAVARLPLVESNAIAFSSPCSPSRLLRLSWASACASTAGRRSSSAFSACWWCYRHICRVMS